MFVPLPGHLSTLPDLLHEMMISLPFSVQKPFRASSQLPSPIHFNSFACAGVLLTEYVRSKLTHLATTELTARRNS